MKDAWPRYFEMTRRPYLITDSFDIKGQSHCIRHTHNNFAFAWFSNQDLFPYLGFAIQWSFRSTFFYWAVTFLRVTSPSIPWSTCQPAFLIESSPCLTEKLSFYFTFLVMPLVISLVRVIRCFLNTSLGLFAHILVVLSICIMYVQGLPNRWID